MTVKGELFDERAPYWMHTLITSFATEIKLQQVTNTDIFVKNACSVWCLWFPPRLVPVLDSPKPLLQPAAVLLQGLA